MNYEDLCELSLALEEQKDNFIQSKRIEAAQDFIADIQTSYNNALAELHKIDDMIEELKALIN